MAEKAKSNKAKTEKSKAEKPKTEKSKVESPKSEKSKVEKSTAKPKADAVKEKEAAAGGFGGFLKNHKLAVGIIAIIILLIACVCAYCTFIITTYGSGDKIGKGITIDGVDVGGMSKGKAVATLMEKKENQTKNAIEIVMGDNSVTLPFSEIETEYLPEQAVNKALNYGKKGDILKRLEQCFKIRDGKVKYHVSVKVNEESISEFIAAYSQSVGSTVVENMYSVENDRLMLINGKAGEGINKKKVAEDIKAIVLSGKSGKINVEFANFEPAPWNVDEIYKKICVGPADASFKEENGKGYIVEAKNGYEFDKEELKKLIEENVGNDQPYYLELDVVEPTVTTTSQQGLFSEVISEYKSPISGDANRRTNVSLACQGINGTILNPDEVFSYNETLGPITSARGYRSATIFTTKGHELGIGGGICQVSSTLYCAALYGDMEIVKRRNHTYLVGYVPYGQDATVYEGELDFRFKNNTNEPIKITADFADGYVTIKILGKKPDPSKTIEIRNVTIGTNYPRTIVEETTALRAGQVQVQQYGSVGYTVDTYKQTYKDGVMQKEEFLHRSVYSPINRIELRGVGTVTETPPATETPGADVPSTDTPSTDTPSTDTPSTDVPSVDTPNADVPGTDTPSQPAENPPATQVPTTPSTPAPEPAPAPTPEPAPAPETPEVNYEGI